MYKINSPLCIEGNGGDCIIKISGNHDFSIKVENLEENVDFIVPKTKGTTGDILVVGENGGMEWKKELDAFFQLSIPDANVLSILNFSYATVGNMIYRGSNVSPPINSVLALANSTAGASFQIRLYSPLTEETIAESDETLSADKTLVNLNINSIPTEATYLEIQVKKIGGGITGVVNLYNLACYS